MDDVELDRALNAALSTSPSPEFVARVRATLAETRPEPLAAGWWKPAIVLACVAALAGTAAFWRLPAHPPIATPPLSSRPLSGVGNAPRIAVSAIELAPAAAILEPTRSEPPQPEVLVAADDVRAFNDLLVSVRERRFEATFDDTPVATPWATHLTLAPINIEPLDQPATNNN